MEKIIIKVCSGTLCYVMGGAELQLLGDSMQEQMADKVEIRGVTCLDCCNKGVGKAPYVMVGDSLVASATIAKVIEEIQTQLSEENK